MGKHAYLIMAHNQWGQLRKLLSCLDHPDNDIFLHIDRKASCDRKALTSGVTSAGVFFTRQLSVSWGGYSQIAAELVLLEEATTHGCYDYYHLLTGVDLPLRTQTEIHAYFSAYKDTEFISGAVPASELWFADRIRYYYPFQEIFSRQRFWDKALRRIYIGIQKLLGVNRLRKSDLQFGIGSAYFDITDRFARYVVGQKDAIKKQFRSTFCADEIFLPWVYLHWQDPNSRYHSGKTDHPYIEQTYFDVNRAIDWVRGRPYVFKQEDYSLLMASGCLFARKFDESADEKIVDTIVARAKENAS